VVAVKSTRDGPRRRDIVAAKLKFKTDTMQTVVPAMQSVNVRRRDGRDADPTEGLLLNGRKWKDKETIEMIAVKETKRAD
jgi:hypothetical protein